MVNGMIGCVPVFTPCSSASLFQASTVVGLPLASPSPHGCDSHLSEASFMCLLFFHFTLFFPVFHYHFYYFFAISCISSSSLISFMNFTNKRGVYDL